MRVYLFFNGISNYTKKKNPNQKTNKQKTHNHLPMVRVIYYAPAKPTNSGSIDS